MTHHNYHDYRPRSRGVIRLIASVCPSLRVCGNYVMHHFLVQDYIVHHWPVLCTTDLRCAPFCMFVINSVCDGAQYTVVNLAALTDGLCVFVSDQGRLRHIGRSCLFQKYIETNSAWLAGTFGMLRSGHGIHGANIRALPIFNFYG